MTNPYSNRLTAFITALAANATGAFSVLRAPYAGVVKSVSYVPNAAINGADTNTRTLAVVNKAKDGAGATNVASLALANGVNATAFDEKAITLNATPANLVVAEGDILAFTSTHAGTGIADPGGMVVVEISRTITPS